MEKFKMMNPGEPVRLASTSGHVVMVGDEFTPVPDHLVREAHAKGLMSETVYNQAKDQVKKELAGAGKTPEELQTEAAARNQAIVQALATITGLVDEGKDASPAGNKLVHNGSPVLAAVSEFAGFEVKRADIEAALA